MAREISLIIEFTGRFHMVKRILFVIFWVYINFIILKYCFDKAFLPEFDELPRYLVNVQSTKCFAYSDEKDSKYDLQISSYGTNYWAIGIEKPVCYGTLKRIKKSMDLDVWHREGVIYHIEAASAPVLNHEYLRKKIRSQGLSDARWVLFLLPAMWLIAWGTLVNLFTFEGRGRR